MDFSRITKAIQDRADERRRSNPEIERELQRLEKFPSNAPGSQGGDHFAALNAELTLANIHYNPCQIVPGTRYSFLKRIVLRVARLFMTGQVQFNASSVRVLNELQKWVSELAEENARLKSEQQDLLDLVRLLERRDTDAIWKTQRRTSPVEGLRKELLGSQSFPNSLAFLEQFRGSESQVEAQLLPYLELFQYHEPIVDLGCGRGEFIGLAAAKGMEAVGVEADPLLAEYVRKKGLKVVEQDMFEHLEGRPDESIGGVFASQVIEHLDWNRLSALLLLTRQKLSVGGILVVESINPVCLSVFAEGLYVDPTHIRPYHPAGIAFLCENLGYSETETRFSAPVAEDRRFQGFSEYQHYAIIARK